MGKGKGVSGSDGIGTGEEVRVKRQRYSIMLVSFSLVG